MIVGGVQDVSELPQIDCRRAESVIIQNHTKPYNSNTFNTNTDTIPHRRRVEFNICHKASVTDSQDCRDEDFEKVKIAFGDFGDLEVAIQMVVEVVVEAKKLDKVLVAATLDKDK